MTRFTFEDYVIKTLDELKADMKDVREKDIPALRTAVENTKSRKRFYAAVVAAVPGCVAVIAQFF